MVTNLIKFEDVENGSLSRLKEKIKDKVIIKQGFKNLIDIWTCICVSLDTKELVIGYDVMRADMVEVFVDESYFENNAAFIIEKETDPNLSQKTNYYCYDLKRRLIWKKINYHPAYEIEWDIIFSYDKMRKLKIMSFLDDLDTEDEKQEG